MAVYCSVCARQLSNAAENGGSFQTALFLGWNEARRYHIDDTCEDCAGELRKAVAKAADRIARRKANATRVEARRFAARAEDDRQTRYEIARAEALADLERRFR